jgi:hypothetical protein
VARDSELYFFPNFAMNIIFIGYYCLSKERNGKGKHESKEEKECDTKKARKESEGKDR